ncbi:MAG: peptide chain release factor N(5)-glutamine methyltransferase [Blastocatellia bacterium]|nr:peptide chain release factor N(5)-glutamine methyltransferase [Blastocatellia bacterium]
MPTIAETLRQASQQLRDADIPNDLLDAQTLLAHALGQDRTYLIIHFNELLSNEKATEFQSLIQRRAVGEPLQYIVGHQQFYGLEFDVTPAVLIPRPETELIIEETLRLAVGLAHPVVVDVGTGSGCLAITLARELDDAQVFATDISSDALQIARHNAQKHNLSDRIEFYEADLLNGLSHRANFIVSNPPYIAEQEISTLQREVRDWEPRVALTDFADGLQYYRRLLTEAPAHLKPQGYLIFEMGYQQAKIIKALIDHTIWSEPKALKDLQGIERTMVLSLR